MKVCEQIHEIMSEDSSPTLFSEVFGESYRSASGAVTESEYLFLRNGLLRHLKLSASAADAMPYNASTTRIVRILEYGFGTGLNALVTAAAAARGELPAGTVIEYTSIDLYPLNEEKCSSLRYDIDCPGGSDTLLRKIHATPWNKGFTGILPNFRLRKLKVDFLEYNPLEDYTFSSERPVTFSVNTPDESCKVIPWIDVVYFDPFSPECEPECWSEQVFMRISAAMRSCAVLSTYSAKGDVKRALRAAGLSVHRIPGTGRKRHNLTAFRHNGLSEREQAQESHLEVL